MALPELQAQMDEQQQAQQLVHAQYSAEQQAAYQTYQEQMQQYADAQQVGLPPEHPLLVKVCCVASRNDAKILMVHFVQCRPHMTPQCNMPLCRIEAFHTAARQRGSVKSD